MALGGVLIIMAIIVFAVQHFGMYNLYGDVANKWYFYGLVGIVGLIGVILIGWAYLKK
jgi:hypothetical protein